MQVQNTAQLGWSPSECGLQACLPGVAQRGIPHNTHSPTGSHGCGKYSLYCLHMTVKHILITVGALAYTQPALIPRLYLLRPDSPEGYKANARRHFSQTLATTSKTTNILFPKPFHNLLRFHRSTMALLRVQSSLAAPPARSRGLVQPRCACKVISSSKSKCITV